MKKYKHLFWDLDRTIWDFERNFKETFKEIYDKYNLKLKGIKNFEQFVKKYREYNTFLWDLYRNGKIIKEYLSAQRFILTLRYFNINDILLANSIADDYLRLSPLKTNLFPNTIETLDYLKDRYSMHIITNGFEEVQYKKIRISGLSKYFDKIITSEEAGYNKPDKKIFVYSLKKANATAKESLMIGDDMNVDILGAKTVGMDQVYVNYEKLPFQAQVTYEINSMKELAELL